MIALVVANYWVISMSMVFLNSFLLSSDEVSLDAPIFITWIQCVVSVVLIWGVSIAMAPHRTVEWGTALQMLPLTFAFGGMIVFNNLCLKFVGVAFYNVGRSLTTVFNVAMSFWVLGERISARVMGACAVIVVGFLLGVDQEQSSSSSGNNNVVAEQENSSELEVMMAYFSGF